MDQRVIASTRAALLLFPMLKWRLLSSLLQTELRCSIEEADLLIDALVEHGHITIGDGPDPRIAVMPASLQTSTNRKGDL